jgi:hypothetical protein
MIIRVNINNNNNNNNFFKKKLKKGRGSAAPSAV